MTNGHRVFLPITATLLIALPSYGQWIPTNGPVSASNGVATVTALAVKPNKTGSKDLFAGTNTGVFRSTNEGASWNSVNKGLTEYSINVLATTESLVLAGTPKGIFKSSNDGTSWTPANAGLTDSTIQALAANESLALAGTPTGVFVSTNNGELWIPASNGLVNLNISVLGIFGPRLFAGTDGVIDPSRTFGGLYVSTDNGLSWETPDSVVARPSFIFDFAICDSILFVAASGGVFRSQDSGMSWTPVNSGLGSVQSGIRLGSGGDAKLFAYVYNGGLSHGLFFSTDYGDHWAQVTDPWNGYLMRDLAVAGANVFVGKEVKGIFRSSDFGISWTTSDSGLSYCSILSLAGTAQGIFAGTQNDGIFLSTNAGMNWNQLNSGVTTAYDIATIGSSIFAGTPDGVYLSTDGGATWDSANVGIPPPLPVYHRNVYAIEAVADNEGMRIFAAVQQHGVYVSSNNGSVWTAANIGISTTTFQLLAANGTTLVGIGGFGPMYRTTDFGTTWDTAGAGLPNLYNVRALAAKHDEAIMFAALYGDGVFRSTDNGTSWTAANSDLPTKYVTALCTSKENVFVGAFNAVFQSSDNGETWNSVAEGTNSGETSALVAGQDGTSGETYLFKGGTGIWRRRLIEITGIKAVISTRPGKYSLSQNYPNPFNPTTTITFDIPRATEVTLRVFDLLGKEVGTLVDEKMEPGRYSKTFDGTGLASGVYLYELRAGSFVQTRKLVLLR